jgi:hypothetical protein
MNIATSAKDVTAFIAAVAPVIDVLNPAAGKVVSTASALLSAAIAGEEKAVAIVAQIHAGGTITPEQMAEIDAAYDASEARLEADASAADPST